MKIFLIIASFLLLVVISSGLATVNILDTFGTFNDSDERVLALDQFQLSEQIVSVFLIAFLASLLQILLFSDKPTQSASTSGRKYRYSFP